MCTAPPGGSPTCGGSGPASSGDPSPSSGAGNPINLLNGNKYQEETDLAALPGVLGLELKRYYNSQSSHPGLLGAGWRMSYETVLYDFGNEIQIVQADGRRLMFQRGLGQNATLCTSPQPQDGQVRIEAPKDGKGGPTYFWRWADGRTLMFSSGSGGGFPLQSITAATGERVTLAYSPTGELTSIRDPQGRQLVFIYASAAETAAQRRSRALKAIDTPLGRIAYRQDALGRLTEVAQSADAKTPAHSTRIYHYEDRYNGGHPLALTGISVRGPDPQSHQTVEQRLSTYAYNAEGLAVLSTKGRPRETRDGKQVPDTGIEQVEIEYIDKALPRATKLDRKTGEVMPTQFGKAILTNSLGQKTQVTSAVIGGHFRLVEMRGPGCSTCGPGDMGYGYDAAGMLVRSTQLDANGRPLRDEITEHDKYGRTVRVGARTYDAGDAGVTDLLLHWSERHEYADVTYQDGSVAVAAQPSLIAWPSVIAGKEHTLAIEYNVAGQVTKVTERGFSPRADSQLELAPLPISHSTSYKYRNVGGRSVIVEIDGPMPNGPKNSPEDSDITRLQWNARGDQIVKIDYPMNMSSSFGYDDSGRIDHSTGIDGIPISLRYGVDGHIVSIDSAGVVTRVSHDVDGRLTELVRMSGEHMRLAYDLAGQLTMIGDSQNNRVVLKRSAAGNLQYMELLNPEGSVAQRHDFDTATVRDPVLASLRSSIENDGDNLARPAFDKTPTPLSPGMTPLSAPGSVPRSSMTAGLDSKGRTTTYVTDDFDRLIAVNSPVTGLTRFSYDDAGRLAGRQQADGSKAAYERDGAGRVVRITSTNSSGKVDEDATVFWGSSNKPVRLTYKAGEESFGYDNAARLTEHSQITDGQRFTLRYAYDAAGRLSSKTMPDGQTLSYRYREDSHPRAGLLESVWLQGLVNRPIVQDLNSAADRYQRRSFSFGNGLKSQTVLDSQGRIIEAGNGQIGQTALIYDQSVGSGARLNPVELDVRQTQTVALGRRAQAEVAQRLIDRLRGSSTSWLDRFAGQASPRSDPFNLENPKDDSPHEDDLLGRQIEHGAKRLRYDSLSRLTEVERASDASTAALPLAQYRYNVFGQRIAKLVYDTTGKSGKVTYFFHDGTALAAEATADVGASPTRISVEYVQLNGKPVAMLRPGELGTTRVYFVHTDHRNAPLAVTDEARMVVWQAMVGDFGLAAVTAGQRVVCNLRASNQYFDEETGFHYNVFRYFDPVARRYLTPDPMGLSAGPDLYAFALNRPHEFTDPLGLQPRPTDVSSWSFQDRLKYVIEKAIPQVPSEIGAVLSEMVSPTNLAITAGVFAVWAAAQLTPAGWVADVAIAGLGYFFLGEAVLKLMKLTVDTYGLVDNAKCTGDLDQAAKNFARITSEVVVNVGAYGATKVAGILGEFFKSKASGYWELNPFQRGVAIEKALGHNVPPSYPVIDRWDPATGLGTSIKSLDLSAPTYQSASTLQSKVKGYLDTLKSFNGANRTGLNTLNLIKTRSLELAIPGAGTAAQRQVLKDMTAYAASIGITLKIIIVP